MITKKSRLGYLFTSESSKTFTFLSKVKTFHIISLTLLLGIVFVTASLAQEISQGSNELRQIRVQAEADDSASLYALALRRNNDTEFACETSEFKRLMMQSAEKGNVTAVGVCASLGFGQKKNPQLAFQMFEQASQKGDVAAIRLLSRCYREGSGCTQNPLLAYQLASKAATGGDRSSLILLADLIAEGIGTARDRAKAEAIYREVGNKGCGRAFRQLGNLYYGDGPNVVSLRIKTGVGTELACDCSNFSKSINGVEVVNWIKANECYRKAGESGDFVAYRILALHYQYGLGVPPDVKEANQLLQKAANLGDARSFTLLGKNYESGFGVRMDVSKAIEYYGLAGKSGDGSGYRLLGSKYEEGDGLSRDLAKAAEHYHLAGEEGDGDGYYELGRLYLSGQGVLEDKPKAVALFLKAIEFGGASGCLGIGTCYKNGWVVEVSRDKAIEFFLGAVNMGDARGYYEIGIIWQTGMPGGLRDLEKASWNFEEAGRLGYGLGYAELANNYLQGDGVAESDQKFIEYSLKAARLGEWTSRLLLEESLEKGTLPGDQLKNVLSWLEERVARGDKYAIWRLGRCFASGESVSKDINKAVELYSEAARMNLHNAVFDLGQCYESGTGVDKDLSKAHELYESAERLGNKEAKARLSSMTTPQSPSGQAASSDFIEQLIAELDAKQVAPKPLHMCAAKYPEKLKRSGIEGVVEFVFVVGINGGVEQVTILRSPNKQFSAATEEAVSTWKFKPSTLFDEPVKCKLRSTMKFVMKK